MQPKLSSSWHFDMKWEVAKNRKFFGFFSRTLEVVLSDIVITYLCKESAHFLSVRLRLTLCQFFLYSLKKFKLFSYFGLKNKFLKYDMYFKSAFFISCKFFWKNLKQSKTPFYHAVYWLSNVPTIIQPSPLFWQQNITKKVLQVFLSTLHTQKSPWHCSSVLHGY